MILEHEIKKGVYLGDLNLVSQAGVDEGIFLRRDEVPCEGIGFQIRLKVGPGDRIGTMVGVGEHGPNHGSPRIFECLSQSRMGIVDVGAWVRCEKGCQQI